MRRMIMFRMDLQAGGLLLAGRSLEASPNAFVLFSIDYEEQGVIGYSL
jgi:hypothetical protein